MGEKQNFSDYLAIFLSIALVIGVVVIVGPVVKDELEVWGVRDEEQFGPYYNLNKTGYVENIEFVGGGLFGHPEETVIQFSDGEILVLRGYKTSIPINQNVMLLYHESTFFGNHWGSTEIIR